MQQFLERYHDCIRGVLRGFDRVLFRGTLRRISSVAGLSSYFSYREIRLVDFRGWAEDLTARVRKASEAVVERAGRPLHYVAGRAVRKEDLARTIAERDNIREGLICGFTAVEPCMSFDIHRNRERKRLELVARERRCLWVYHYLMHPQLGFMHARIQTWAPFTVKICINGREWLARHMSKAGIDFVRKRNCFIDIANVESVQQLALQQLRTNWPRLLDGIVEQLNPLHQELFRDYPLPYYWSADETEWATDIMFRSTQQLSALYPSLLRQAISGFQSDDVMRFLGQIHPDQRSRPNFKGEVVSDVKRRPEGIRIKHRLNANSIKMYNKEGSVLRIETTINNARDLKVYRPPHDKPRGKHEWKRMRKGVADLHRRAMLSDASNHRYIEALAPLSTDATLAQLMQPLCQPTYRNGRRCRGLNPLAKQDRDALAAVCRGEFAISGLRNKDLRVLLYPTAKDNDAHACRCTAAKATRMLGLLRAHRIIKKLPKSHRYTLTDKGRQITALLSLASNATPCQLERLAA